MRAYERRYQRELHDIGIATALAHHDPKALEQAFKPKPPAPEKAEKWW